MKFFISYFFPGCCFRAGFLFSKLFLPVFAVTGLFVAPESASAIQFQLDKRGRTSLDMTVYNSDLAVIEDRRTIELARGEIELHFSDVAMSIQPPTVSLQSEERGFVAVQQNYRFDLLNRQTLLERFVGRKLKYSRFLTSDEGIEKVLREGVLLSLNPEIVQFGDVIEVEPEGTISLPYLPEGLETSPTLVFTGENGKNGAQDLSVRYHASGINWEADYALTLAGKAELDSWVTMRNLSGTDFYVDNLRLVAGSLNRIAEPRALMRAESAVVMDSAAMGPMQAKEAGDYHAYDYPWPVQLQKNDMTQLRLIQVDGIDFDRYYKVTGVANNYGNQGTQEISPEIWVSFDNTKANNLNEPLPAGNVRVYEVVDGRETFVGENRLDHTHTDDTVELMIGRAFDLSATRVQTSFRRLGERAVQVAYEIEVQNTRKSSVIVNLEEKMRGDWAVVSQSQKGRKSDSSTYEFELKVPGKGKASVSYELQITW